jgi:hypothetical protein
MRHIKLLGLAPLAVFAFGAALASAAPAINPGVLYLGTETAPVTVTVANQAVATSLINLLPSKKAIGCTEFAAAGTIGKASETHSNLGELGVTYKGCTTENGTVKCASQTTAGVKDTSGTILLQAANTDLHLVALETAAKALVPGVLIGLLEENKVDLTLVCGLVKFKALGAIFFEVQGTNLETEEHNSVRLEPTRLTCDKEDTLCKEELAKWGVKVGETLCPLAVSAKEPKDEECDDYVSPAVTAALNKKVTWDF